MRDTAKKTTSSGIWKQNSTPRRPSNPPRKNGSKKFQFFDFLAGGFEGSTNAPARPPEPKQPLKVPENPVSIMTRKGRDQALKT